MKAQRVFAKDRKGAFLRKDALIEAYSNLLKRKVIDENHFLRDVLKIKKVRSVSGTVSISVLTKPFDCPGNCLYCPKENGLPKSYLSDEPAVMRARMNNFDPYMQVHNRIKALEAVGHKTSKISVRIVGGTWSFYDRTYQTWFVKRLFQACSDYPNIKPLAKKRLSQLQKENISAQRMIVEMGIETRQNFITEDEIKRLRFLGVTKVELGVQSIYDGVLRKNNRGNNTADTIKATAMLKDAGFKVSYQIMLNLYGSTIAKDSEMFDLIFSPNFSPDNIKIYPLAVLKEAPMYKIYMQKKFKIYSDEELVNLISDIKGKVPSHCRIERIIRDIPAHYIEAGCKKSNLRQIIQFRMKELGLTCKCIRCREVRDYVGEQPKLFCCRYEASGGQEIFLSYESDDRKRLYGFLRLRLPSYLYSEDNHFIAELAGAAVVREISIYGQGIASAKNKNINMNDEILSGKLLKRAIAITKVNHVNRIAVMKTSKQQFCLDRGFKIRGEYLVKQI
jgi:elongator complex protein 3